MPADGNTIGAVPFSQLTVGMLNTTVQAIGKARLNIEDGANSVTDAAVITEDMSQPLDTGSALIEKLEQGLPTNPQYALGPLQAYLRSKPGWTGCR